VTSSRAGSRAASELGKDLRVHVVCVSQAKFHYAVQLATSSRAGRRPASEQDSVMEYGLNLSATRFELSRHVCDLDSVKEFSQSIRCSFF